MNTTHPELALHPDGLGNARTSRLVGGKGLPEAERSEPLRPAGRGVIPSGRSLGWSWATHHEPQPTDLRHHPDGLPVRRGHAFDLQDEVGGASRKRESLASTASTGKGRL